MARIKLTKSAVDAAKPQAQAVELRDTVVPGFLCKITPAGRKVFMLQYRTNAGERRKPALGQYGELTVEQARVMAQEWLNILRSTPKVRFASAGLWASFFISAATSGRFTSCTFIRPRMGMMQRSMTP